MKRRHFLRHAALAVGAFTSAPFIRGAAPGRKFRTALIGCGWWGKNILKEAMASGRCKIVALGDVDANALEVAGEQVNDLSGDTPKLYRDYRELLEKEKPDIVIIATPDHWHALNTIAALAEPARTSSSKSRPATPSTKAARWSRPRGTAGASCRSGCTAASARITSAA